MFWALNPDYTVGIFLFIIFIHTSYYATVIIKQKLLRLIKEKILYLFV